jgi:hypothetical protein
MAVPAPNLQHTTIPQFLQTLAREAASPMEIFNARSRWRNILGWLGIVAGAVVFVAALALSLDDPALVVALAIELRGGRLILDI